MDNMALIEMSSMHYINMPKIVSISFSSVLKSISYRYDSYRKYSMSSKSSFRFFAKMEYPSFADSRSWRNPRWLVQWITSRVCINFNFSKHHIHVSVLTMNRFKASSTCFFPTQKRCSRRWTTSTRLGKIKVFWTIWALRWVTHQNLKEVVPLTWCIMQKYCWKHWLKSTYLV